MKAEQKQEGLLRVEGLRKTFPGAAHPAVQEVSFVLYPGEMFVLLGPSGCGKTTTLRILGGFASADAGRVSLGERVLLDGKTSLPPERREIGFVFQDYALFPHMTVEQNVGFGLRQLSSQERLQKVRELLDFVELSGFGARMPDELSGGEQQRVALARSLAPEPNVLLLDEPFSNLDEKRREQMRIELRELLRKRGISSILVTHHQQEALGLADRMGVMKEGRLLQVGTPEEIYHSPTNSFVAGFLGQTNLLLGEGKGDFATTPLGSIPLLKPHHGPVQLSLRPEQWSLVLSHEEPPVGAIVSGLSATLVSCMFQGAFWYCWVDCQGMRLVVRAPSHRSWTSGEGVQLALLSPASVVQVEGASV